MKLSDLINENLIDLNLEAEDKNDAINKVANLIGESGNLESKELYNEEVLLREKTGTTGVGMGIAIPHAKTDGVKKECFAIARLKKELDWDSLDDKPVQLIIMLAVPESKASNTHLKLISKLSTHLMDDDFRDSLKNAEKKEEVLTLINKIEGE